MQAEEQGSEAEIRWQAPLDLTEAVIEVNSAIAEAKDGPKLASALHILGSATRSTVGCINLRAAYGIEPAVALIGASW